MHIRSKYTTWTFLLAFKFKSSPIPIHLLHRHPRPDGWKIDVGFFDFPKTYLLGTTRMELSWKMKVNTRSLLPRWVGVGVGPFYALRKNMKKKKSDFVKIFGWMWEWMDFMNPSDETSLRKRRVGLCFVEISSLKVWTTTWSHDCSPWRPGSC